MSDSAITDITIVILREIRDATRTNTEEIRGLKDELRSTNQRIDTTNQRLESVANQIGSVFRYIKNKHETAIDDLRERVTRLEAKGG